MTVLVVEDDPGSKLIISAQLVESGYVVLAAADANDEIDILENHPAIRLVFTDVDMPGSMDAFKLAAFVRDRWRQVHVIVTSGKHTPQKLPKGAVFLPNPHRTKHVIQAMKLLGF